jgi:DNA-binding winged helix-turn-helix (wHTH) protein
VLHRRGDRNSVGAHRYQISDMGRRLSFSADIGDGLAIGIEGVGQMAIETRDVMFKNGEAFAAASTLRQFARQPMSHWDPPSTSRHEVSVSSDAVIRFGRFCVLPRARQLLLDGQPIELGSRAFDLLMALIEAPGILITKKEIMSRVWPDTVVEESNLKVQMSALRRVLSADREVIKTVHGRGYVFTSKVTAASIDPDALARLGAESTAPQLGPMLPASLPSYGSPRRQWASGCLRVVSHDKAPPVVVVIDNDPDIRDALRELPQAIGLCVQSFASVKNSSIAPLRTSPRAWFSTSSCPDEAGLSFKRS